MAIKSGVYSAPSSGEDARHSPTGEGGTTVQQPPPYNAPAPQSALLTVSHHPAVPTGPSPFHSLPMPVTHEQEGAMAAADRRARKRVFAALLWGWGIWLFVGLLTSDIVTRESRGRHRRGDQGNHHRINKLPIPPHALECNGFHMPAVQLDQQHQSRTLGRLSSFFHHDYLNTASSAIAVVTYSLPLSSLDTLTFDSSGGYTSGIIDITIENDEVERDVQDSNGRIEIQSRYNDPDLFEKAQVCLIRRKTSDNAYSTGLLLKTPEYDEKDSHRERTIKWKVMIRLPKHLDSLAGLKIVTQQTAVHWTISDTQFSVANVLVVTTGQPILFNSLNSSKIDLSTSNGRIQLQGAYGSKAVFAQTTNGRIDGVFTSPNVILRTSNAEISGSFESQGVVDLTTSNANIDAVIALVTPNILSLKSTTTFLVSARSKNGQVNVEYLKQPTNSLLRSEICTTNANASVKLHPEYQGTLKVETKTASAQLSGPYTSSDPLHAGRTRILNLDKKNTASLIKGSVSWNHSDEAGNPNKRGSSIVSSTNGKAETVLL